jgi:hypothetical protein
MRFIGALVVVAVLVGGCANSEPDVEVVAHVGESVTTDQAAYSNGQTITASWSGLPGNATDWIAIAPAGSDLTVTMEWHETGGAVAGSATFIAPSTSSSNVIRAFANGGYEFLAESAPFSVAASSIGSDQPSYSTGVPVTISWSGLPGNQHDFVAIAPAGSPSNVISTWRYTNGAAAGSFSYIGLPNGTYVARAFLNDTYTLLVQSAPFTISGATTATVTRNKSSYAPGEDVVITWSGLPGYPQDWIAMSPQNGLPHEIVRWAYTNGQSSGTLTFPAPTQPGNYEIRAYINNQYILIATSQVFAVP